MKNNIIAIATLVSLGWSSPFATMAQTNDQEALNKLYGDFAPSDLTAATLLGVDASKVSKPSTVKAVSASLIQPTMGFSKAGSGLAVEVAPVLFFPNGKILTGTNSLKQYGNFGNAVLRNWTLSGAAVGDSSSTKVAAGLALTLYDGTDRLRVETFVADLVTKLNTIKAGQDLSNLTRAASLQAGQHATELLKRNGIVQSLPERGSTTNDVFLLLHGRIAGLGETPVDNAQIPSAAQIEQGHGKLLVWLQRSLDSLSRVHPPGIDVLLPKLNASDIMAGAQLLAVQGTAAYDSYRALNTDLVTQTTGAVKKANEQFDKQTWNATIIQAGFGSTWASKAQGLSDLSASSTGFFARAALRPGTNPLYARDKKTWLGYALAHHALLVTNVRYNGYRNQPSFAEQKPATQMDSLRDQIWIGGRLLVGSQYFRISGEFSKRLLWYSNEAKNGANAAKKNLINAWNSYAIGAEVRLTEKLWVEFGVGETYPDGQRKGQVFALSSIKYSIQNTQRFTTQ